MDELLTLGALLLVGYLLYKSSGQISQNVKNKVNSILGSVRKFVTFLFIVILSIFFAGEVYAAMIIGYFPSDHLFWLPFYFLILALLFYYMG